MANSKRVGFSYRIYFSVKKTSGDVRISAWRPDAFCASQKSIWGFPVSSKKVNSFRVLKKSTPLGGTRVALMNVMSISWYLMLIVTPMHFSYSNISIHYLNQDKYIYQDAHWENLLEWVLSMRVLARECWHARAECQHTSDETAKSWLYTHL